LNTCAASFDGQPDADFARGDKHIYTAPNFKRTEVKPGLHRTDVEIVSATDAANARVEEPVALATVEYDRPKPYLFGVLS
jgi:hypothetical protein